MRIALDATYSIAKHPSGVAVYAREILAGLPRLFPGDTYLPCYRWKQWRAARFFGTLLLPPLPSVRADIFHAMNQRVDRRPAPRVVTTYHDLFVMTASYSSPEFRQRFARQAQVAAANSDLIIAVSRFTASQVEDLLHVPSSRIRVIPHGVHQPSRPRTPSRPPFILSVGTIQSRKNTGALVRAFESIPEPWHLVLAGAADGHGSAEILHQIGDSTAASRIKVTGYVSAEKLSDLYASATLFAFPSLDEGFGIPVLEAMAHGLPVLTSNTSALKEIGEGAALLVNPRSAEEITHGLLEMVQREALREQLSRKGKTRSLQYSWEASVEATHAVYMELK